MKTYVYPKNCTQMFIFALVTLAKTWKQLRCVLVDKWANILRYYQAMKYAALKNKQTQKAITTATSIRPWKDMEGPSMHIAMQKKSIWKGYIHTVPTMWHSGKGKTKETLYGSVVAMTSYKEREFWGQWKYSVWYTQMVDTHH